ncbi:MAG: YdeI/OmpD-associated family protein, partial [Gemmatimonadota bacterium]
AGREKTEHEPAQAGRETAGHEPSQAGRETVRFAATIYKLGINPCVDVPRAVSDAFGRRGYVPVVGTLNGHPIRPTLVPKGGGRHRLYVNGQMRRVAGVGVGDEVRFELCFDSESREIPVPDDLRAALRKVEGAEAGWERLTPSHRKELLVAILDAKKPETRARRIQRAIHEHVLRPRASRE